MEPKSLSKVHRQRKNKWRRPETLKSREKCENETWSTFAICVSGDQPQSHVQSKINSKHCQNFHEQVTYHSVESQLAQEISPLGMSSSSIQPAASQQPIKPLERGSESCYVKSQRETDTLLSSLPPTQSDLVQITSSTRQSSQHGTSQHDPSYEPERGATLIVPQRQLLTSDIDLSMRRSPSYDKQFSKAKKRPHDDEPESLFKSGSTHVDSKQVESHYSPITHESNQKEVQSKFESYAIECQMLRTYFDQLLTAITDPDKLAAKLYAEQIISVDTLKEIMSKAEGTQAKTLTLLLAVQEQVSISPVKKFMEFVEILRCHNAPSLRHLAYKLDPNLTKSDSGSSGLPEMTHSSIPGTGNHQTGTTRLTDRHHSVLCEYLNRHAAHWRTIGQYLGFLPGELDIVQHKPTLIVSGPVAYLGDMLATWLQWAPGDGRGSENFATLQALKYALSKAGFGVSATELTMSTLSTESPLGSVHTIISNDSKSEYQQNLVLSRSEAHQSTSWTVGEPIGKPMEQKSKSLSAYYEYANYLRHYYTQKQQRDDKWPHLGVRKYIKLAVISNEFESKKDLNQFRVATIHGSIDNILEAKSLLELHEIFLASNNFSYRHKVGNVLINQKKKGGVYVSHKIHHITQVLIEGAPGIGKSTLSWEICERWGRGELFTHFTMVLLLKFRDKRVQDAKCLSDLFLCDHHWSHEFQQCITREIEATQGKGLLLILDGYDEAPTSLQTSCSMFLDLFTGKLLPNATVVITTRPSASSKLRLICKGDRSRRIEVLGFGVKEIREYIQSIFSQHIEKIADFEQYLDLYPHIHSMMYVPLNSAIITCVYQECKLTSSIFPKTMTQLFSSLVRTLLLRYLKEQPEHKSVIIRDFTDLPKAIYKQFLWLCQISYSGIIKAKTEYIFSHLPSDFDSLGLMQSCPELYCDCGESFSYNFLHLIMQEFLAAYHISLFEEDTFSREVETIAEKPVVLQFLAGLCQSKILFWKTVRKLLPASFDGTVSLHILHLLFESQDLAGYTTLGCGKVCFHTQSSMKPFDSYVLGSCIANSVNTCTWEVDCSHLDCVLFVKGIISKTTHAQQTIILKGITEDGLYSLSSALEFNLTLACLHIIAKEIKSKRAIQGLLKLVQLVNLSLQYLKLVESKIGHSGAVELAKVLQTNCTLKHLNLSGNVIEHEGVNYLAEALETNSTLEHLDLSVNTIQNEGAVQLAKELGKNSTLKYLNLSDNAIQNIGAIHLAKALETNTSLKYLKLSNNKVENEGAIYLAKALETNSTLEHLDLNYNEIVNRGVIHLCKALETNSTLKYLGISLIYIDDSVCVSIDAMLRCNQSLETLDLSGNTNFTVDGVSELITSLRYNTTLKRLRLSSVYYRFFTCDTRGFRVQYC